MEIMKPFRKRIDDLDDQIIDLMVQRTEIIREVADFKSKNDIPAVLQDRVDEVRERCAARAEAQGMDPEIIRTLYAALIKFSCDLEEELMAATSENRKSA